MDELENEESFRMVRANRDCYPKGERMILTTEKECREMIQSKRQAERDSKASQLRADAAEARVRAWQVISAAVAAVSCGAGFLIGILI